MTVHKQEFQHAHWLTTRRSTATCTKILNRLQDVEIYCKLFKRSQVISLLFDMNEHSEPNCIRKSFDKLYVFILLVEHLWPSTVFCITLFSLQSLSVQCWNKCRFLFFFSTEPSWPQGHQTFAFSLECLQSTQLSVVCRPVVLCK